MGFVLFSGCFGIASQDKTKYNVILISLDTLRADRLGCYGYGRNTSPHIDEFASGALMFSDTITQSPWTLPSHFSMFTSLYVFQHNFSKEPPMLAEVLKQEGYTTAAFIDAAYLDPFFGFDAGFDLYDDQQRGGHIKSMIPKILAWLDEHEDETFFLFLHFFDIHSPYFFPEPYRSMFIGSNPSTFIPDLSNRSYYSLKLATNNENLTMDDVALLSSLYDGGIRYTDDHLSVLFDYFKQNGLYNNTLIILVADHGEAFGESPDGCPAGVALSHSKLLETILHVPMIMRFPDSVYKGTNCEPTQLIDIVPTILDFLDIQTNHSFSGASLIPYVEGNKTFGGTRFRLSQRGYRSMLIKSVQTAGNYTKLSDILENGENSAYVVSVPSHPYDDMRVDSQYVYKCDLGCASLSEGQNLLYDVIEDPYETTNIIKNNTEVAENLRKIVHNILIYERGVGYEQKDAEVDQETIDQLKALGYIN